MAQNNRKNQIVDDDEDDEELIDEYRADEEEEDTDDYREDPDEFNVVIETGNHEDILDDEYELYASDDFRDAAFSDFGNFLFLLTFWM